MATRSSVLAWRIPGTVEPEGLPSMGSHRVGHDWNDLAAATVSKLYTEISYLKDICKAKISRPPQIANTKTGWTFGSFRPPSLFLFKWSAFPGAFVYAWVCFCLFCFAFQQISFLSPKYTHQSNLWWQDNCCLFPFLPPGIANTTMFSIFSVHMSISNLRL